MYALVDTCVFMDIFFQREKLYDSSLEVFKKLKENKCKIYVSPTTLKDLYYFSKKATHNNKLANEIVNRIYSVTNKIIDITADDAISALYDEGDYEDNLIIESAKRNMLDCIITRNIKDYNNKGIPVFSPEDILKYL